MKKMVLLLLPILFFAIAYSLRTYKSSDKIIVKRQQKDTHVRIDPNCTSCFEKYIEKVINEGSNIFHYPSGPMPGGTVSAEDAKKIAAFLATLQGFKPSHPEWVQEGKYLFYGNCIGCHSNGGKGQKGYFPDLTRKPLLGIEMLSQKGYGTIEKRQR
ncbi:MULTISPECIES: c-type cytochrome [unclassified Nitratiruptor]|uniref:c-type cytochrome n=1 Tax=unclassified Nitratiruptor TaxID=2624044 RepID=UPI001914E8D5|nr:MULTISPECIES: c-type cytochrome [unclassified Nitratiruptor]BCD60608.1 cytochrome c oxidase subunit CcoP [Nitratiruptor sp. YY08-10]BCD64539.1 cytochrome c oxidase subunit CcoP [Nitratiruptor sp. YY08-14]